MLQINTGKFFANGSGQTNEISSVLYSNVGSLPNQIITKAGKLRLAANPDFPYAMNYDLIERFEKTDTKKDRRTVPNWFLMEFSNLATFGLEAILSPDREVVRILTDNRAYSYHSQDKLVQGYFDSRINVGTDDISRFEKFVNDLLMLERKSYLKAKKAITRFVEAIHRIPDNPSMAFTLLVSSIGVLTSPEKNLQATPSMDKNSNQKIFARSNFKKYLTDHIEISELANEEDLLAHPLRHREIERLLNDAYTVRSEHIHNAVPLNRLLTIPYQFRDVREIRGKYHLTLQGLVKITKLAITNFIELGAKIGVEDYDYQKEISGQEEVEPLLHTWLGKKLTVHDIRKQFNGMLEEFTAYFLSSENVTVTNMDQVMADILGTIDTANESDQVTMLAIFSFYNWTIAGKSKSIGSSKIYEKYQHLLEKPYPENLIIRAILGNHDWPLATHEQAVRKYWRERHTDNQIVGGPLFEAVFALDLAERHRLAGSKEIMWEQIDKAVNDFPSHRKLRNFKEEYDGKTPIFWFDILQI